MTQRIIEAKLEFYEARISASSGEASAMASRCDMKLAGEARAVAVTEETAAVNLLSTLIFEKAGGGVELDEVGWGAWEAVEDMLCEEEEEDGILDYYERSYG